jgi:hypothetical protein
MPRYAGLSLCFFAGALWPLTIGNLLGRYGNPAYSLTADDIMFGIVLRE